MRASESERVCRRSRVAVCCSVLQCVAVCCSVLQCVASQVGLVVITNTGLHACARKRESARQSARARERVSERVRENERACARVRKRGRKKKREIKRKRKILLECVAPTAVTVKFEIVGRGSTHTSYISRMI